MLTDTATDHAPRNRRIGWIVLLTACAAANAATAAESAEGLTQSWSRVTELRRQYKTAQLAGTTNNDARTDASPAASLEQKWGIQVSGLFLSAGGNMVDFRYKVTDPVKAAFLTKPETKPELVNETSGAKLLVPDTPKVGQLRQITRQPVVGKMYFILFANTRHHVKSGDKVTIAAGDFKVENLIVE